MAEGKLYRQTKRLKKVLFLSFNLTAAFYMSLGVPSIYIYIEKKVVVVVKKLGGITNYKILIKDLAE